MRSSLEWLEDAKHDVLVAHDIYEEREEGIDSRVLPILVQVIDSLEAVINILDEG